MKKIVIICTMLFALSIAAVGFAAPMTDYSKGRAAVDLEFGLGLDLEQNGKKLDGKHSNIDGSITVGIGNDFAIQYRQADYKGTLDNAWFKTRRLNTQEFNLLYKIDKNVSVFAGFNKAYYTILVPGMELKGRENNGWQVGALAVKSIAPKTSLYGVVAAGADHRKYELGVAYAFKKDMEINLSYMDFKYSDMDVPRGGDADIRVKGLACGVTLKF